MSFSHLGLSAPLLRAISELGFTTPKPIQEESIPVILRGDDLWASAQTGSGKTAAFVLPILQRLSEAPRGRGRFVRALILAPTRELSAQIGRTVRECSRYLTTPLKTLVVYGGVSINPQMMALGGGTDIIVATPGRLLDLIDQNAVSLSAVAILVLDEADRLFDLGFADELNRIISLLPARRQNLFFSATFPSHVNALAEKILQQPVRIDVAASTETAPAILQRAIEVDAGKRTLLLLHLWRENRWSRALVFVATRYATEHLAEKLSRQGFQASPLHGELSQGARDRALGDFKASKIQILISTDLAARGIDILDLPVVVNYDLPRSPIDYTHRIGRTGRAGATGVAINFISADTDAHFRLIEKRQRLTIAREQILGFEPVEGALPQNPGGGVKGKRKSKKDKLREAAAAPRAQESLIPRAAFRPRMRPFRQG